MDNYLVSARKYRPDTFMSVVGQGALTTTLQNAIKNDKLAHAYLFCGPRGVGKTTCARIFAKTINCMNPHDGEACNECESCRSFNEQRSLNIVELDAASNNGVDDIRSLVEQVRIPPVLGKYKVYIIDEVHMLSTAAFNAFLKTLEEPPAYAIFILATTEKHKIIPTILSRCQIYDFHRISINDIQGNLKYVAESEGIAYEPQALNIIAMKADGGMRDALSIFDQVASFGEGKITYKGAIDCLNVLDYDYYFKLVEAFLAHDTARALLLFDEILNMGFEGMHFIGGLCAHLRDLMVCKNPGTVKLLEVSDDIRAQYQQQAAACDFSYLVYALKLANECSLQYNQSRNKRLLVELCLIRLCVGDPVPGGGKGPLTIASGPAGTTAGASTSGTTSAAAQQASAQATAQQVSATAAALGAASAPSSTLTSATIQTPATQASANQTPAQTLQMPDAQTPAQTSQPAVQTPAPTAQTPAAQPTAKPLPGKMPVTLSLKKRAQENTAQDQEQTARQPEENTPFTAETLTKVLNEYAAQTFTDDPQLRNAILAEAPEKISDTHFEISVFHPNMEARLKEVVPQIERHLRNTLHNSHVELSVRITEGEEKKLALLPQDQLRELQEKYPELTEFRSRLGLELEL